MSKWDRVRRALLKVKALGEARAGLALAAAAERAGDGSATVPREPAVGDMAALREHLRRDAQAEETSVFEAAFRAVVDQASPPSGPTHFRVDDEEPAPPELVPVAIEQPELQSPKLVRVALIQPETSSGSATDDEPSGLGMEVTA